MKISASILLDFISLLYVLALGYKQIELKLVQQELKNINWEAWESLIPSIKQIVKDIKQGKADYRLALADELKDCLPHLKADQQYTTDELTMVNNIRLWLEKDADSKWATIVKKAPLYSSFASSILYDDSFDPDVVSAMSDILDQYNIISDSVLITVEQQKQFKQNYPEAFEDYKTLRSEFLNSVRSVITSYINSNGGKVPYQNLYNFLSKKDLEYVIPRGFTGLIDTALAWYSPDGQLLDGNLPATTYPVVEMNPNFGPDSQWVARAMPNTGNAKMRYIYTVEQIKQNQKNKFAKVSKIIDNIDSYRKKWLKLIRSFDPDKKDCVSAIVLELLYQTAGRVGSFNNEHGTYGINTLQVRHMSLASTGAIVLKYKGKDGVNTRYVIKTQDESINKILIPLLKDLVADKVDPKEPIFTLENGTLVTPKDTNALFKRIVGDPNVNVHKIRTFRGTALFKELVEQSKVPTTQAEAGKLWKDMGLAVGQRLNHIRTNAQGQEKATGSTALQNYIDPAIQIKFFADAGFRVPKLLEKYL